MDKNILRFERFVKQQRIRFGEDTRRDDRYDSLINHGAECTVRYRGNDRGDNARSRRRWLSSDSRAIFSSARVIIGGHWNAARKKSRIHVTRSSKKNGRVTEVVATTPDAILAALFGPFRSSYGRGPG